LSYTLRITMLDDEGLTYKLELLDIPTAEDLPDVLCWTRIFRLKDGGGFDVLEDEQHLDIDDESRTQFERMTRTLAEHQYRMREKP
jgi:hypothetical protein